MFTLLKACWCKSVLHRSAVSWIVFCSSNIIKHYARKELCKCKPFFFACILILLKGTVLATLAVYDADTTSVYPIESSRKKYTGTISTSDPWIKEKFRVEHDFHEINFSPNGSQVRGTRHEYSRFTCIFLISKQTQCAHVLSWLHLCLIYFSL